MFVKIVANDGLSYSIEELKNGLTKLFDIQISDNEYDVLFVLKSIDRNLSWKESKLQKFTLNYVDYNKFEITGASNAAVFYGVCELLSIYGVKYLLTEDVYPEKTTAFYLPKINKEYEPRQTIREWRVLSDFLSGGEGRSLREQLTLIKQLAKQKNNSIKLDVWLFPPFLNYSCINPSNGEKIEKKGGKFHCAQKFEVKEESISSKHTKVTKQYTNPDFINCVSDEEISSMAEFYLKSIISEAKKYDMRVSIQFNPFDYPEQFAPMLENPKRVQQIGDVQVCEGGDICNEKSLFMIKLVFDTILSKYYQCDVFIVVMPEIARSVEGYERAIDNLDKKFNIKTKFNLDTILDYNDDMDIMPGGKQRSYLEGRMNIQLIDSIYQILDKSGIANKLFSDNKKIGISCGSTTPHLLPLYSSIMDDGYELYIGSYTCLHTVKTMNYYKHENFANADIVHVLTLEDDNIGGIIQSNIKDFSEILSFNTEHHINAFSTRFWPTGDIEELSLAISNACWSMDNVLNSFNKVICGLFERTSYNVCKSFEIIDDCMRLFNSVDLDATFQINGHVSHIVGDKTYKPSICFLHAIIDYGRVINTLEDALCFDNLSIFETKRLKYLLSRVKFSQGLLKQYEYLTKANNTYYNISKEKAKEEYKLAIEYIRKILNDFSRYMLYDNDLAHLVIYEQLCVNEVEDKIKCLFLG